MNTLSKKQHAKMLLTYSPCDLMTTFFGGNKPIKMKPYTSGYVMYITTLFENPEPFKPILTPISKIRDEDVNELWALLDFNPQFPITPSDISRKDYIIKRFDRFNSSSCTTSLHKIIVASDYLRSKHYDLGYLHIPSLIEAGYAVDKTTLTNE